MPIPSLTHTPVSDAPTGNAQKSTSSSTNPLVPFTRSAKWHVETSNTDAITLTANAITRNYPITSYGYLSGIMITATASGGVAGGTNAVYFEDAPWSVFSQVIVQDTNGTALFQLSGYNSYLAMKYGSYRLFAPDGSALTSIYTKPTSGNFSFILVIFFEFGQDGLGCLPNMDASARYNLQLTIAAGVKVGASTGPVYTTAPGTAVTTLTLTVEILARGKPPAQDMFGNQNSISPPGVGTAQYWTDSILLPSMANGKNTPQLTRVGNVIRNHILVFRNTNGTRASAEGADVPAAIEFDWDAGQRFVINTATARLIFGYMVFGQDVPNGVIIFPYTTDPNKLALSEFGDEWMGTVGATKLLLQFTTTAAAGSLDVITNDIVPASATIYQAPALAIGG